MRWQIKSRLRETHFRTADNRFKKVLSPAHGLVVSKLGYLQRTLAAQFQRERFCCQNCSSRPGGVVDRKYGITQLRRCRVCGLLYRSPTDPPGIQANYYEHEYRQGFTTELPDVESLELLKVSNFAGSQKDYSHYIDVLRQFGIDSGARLFDFGCSWGYGSYQFAKAGMEVVSFEIGETRRRYASEQLAVNTISSMSEAATILESQFDCFFSAHVLEHVPAPAVVFDYARRLLKPGGLFVSFTPNGCQEHRKVSAVWSRLWGEVHPNFIDEVFLDRSFRGSPRAIGSSPIFSGILPRSAELRRLNALDGGELFFAARKIAESWN